MGKANMEMGVPIGNIWQSLVKQTLSLIWLMNALKMV